MSNEKKLKPMSNLYFKGMTWLYKIADFFGHLKKHMKNIPLKEGMTVVDYGCGPGRFTIPAAKIVAEKGKVIAVDIQPLAISTVKKKANHEGLTNIKAILIDSYDTGIQSSSIDMVLLIDVIHEIEDRDTLFKELYRILKRDGIVFMYPEHMNTSKAKEIVESTGLFKVKEILGQDMLIIPKPKANK